MSDCQDPIANRLQRIRLQGSECSICGADDICKACDKILGALSELLQYTPRCIIEEGLAEGGHSEIKVWSAMISAFQQELEHRRAAGQDPDLDAKRQVLADLLVLAEVTAPSYDQAAAQFIISPHMSDPSFSRLGKLLADAYKSEGVEFSKEVLEADLTKDQAAAPTTNKKLIPASIC